MRWLRGCELGLGARAGSLWDCLQSHVSLRVLPALPREHSLADPACCFIAPHQNSSLKLLLEWGLCWVLPPGRGDTPSLGCWLPSRCPATLVPGPKVIVPALKGEHISGCARRRLHPSGMAHTTPDMGALGCLARAFPTVTFYFFLLFCQLFLAAEAVRSVEEHT